MAKNTQNKQFCFDFGKLFFLVIFIALFVGIKSGNSQAIDSFESCKKINGNYRIYGNSCGDECLPQFNKYLSCVNEIKYACDCGENSCLYRGKCIANSEFEPIYKKIQNTNQEKNNNRIEKMANLMNTDAAYSQFIHNIFANYKNNQSDDTKSQAQIMSEKFKQESQQYDQNQQQNQKKEDPKPVEIAIEASTKPLPLPTAPQITPQVPQFFIDQQEKKGSNEPKAAKLPAEEMEMIFPVIPLPKGTTK